MCAEVVSALLYAFPKAVKNIAATKNQTALHLVPTGDVTNALLLAFPGTVKAKDIQNRLPLHTALVRGASSDLITVL